MDLGDLFGGFDTDQLKDVIELVTKNQDALAALGKLPEFLGKVAAGLSGAGEQARAASFALVGEDGTSGVKATLHDASEALSAIVGSLGAGAERIADAAESAARVPLMDGPAGRLADAAQEMHATTGKLGELSEGMEKIGATLATVAAALAKLGEHLDDSGTHAQGFAELT